MSHVANSELIDRINDAVDNFLEVASALLDRNDLDQVRELMKQLEALTEDICPLCGADPMTVNCNNGNCDAPAGHLS